VGRSSRPMEEMGLPSHSPVFSGAGIPIHDVNQQGAPS
jgi:hypothetical protein